MPILAALSLALFAAPPMQDRGRPAPAPAPKPPVAGTGVTRGGVVTMSGTIVRERVIIRMPRIDMPRRGTAVPVPPRRMDEKRGPKCVPVRDLRGATVARKDSVDIMLADGSELRARLDNDCPSMDFYSGFYMRPTPDGMLCADRDIIRARSGRQCPIGSFRRLVPDR